MKGKTFSFVCDCVVCDESHASKVFPNLRCIRWALTLGQHYSRHKKYCEILMTCCDTPYSLVLLINFTNQWCILFEKNLIFVAVHKDDVQKNSCKKKSEYLLRYSGGRACENATLVSLCQYITYL